MANLIIDTSLHVAAFPTTYTGPGTLIGNPLQSGSQDTELYGYFTSVTSDTVTINVGFQPLKVEIFNETDGIEWTWMYGMAATHTIKNVHSGPTITTDTGSAIVPSEAANTGPAGNWTVLLSTTLCGAAKNIIYHISG